MIKVLKDGITADEVVACISDFVSPANIQVSVDQHGIATLDLSEVDEVDKLLVQGRVQHLVRPVKLECGVSPEDSFTKTNCQMA
jgi:hypothetical protein